MGPEGGWNQHLQKQLLVSGCLASPQLVNTFKLDLRDAEVHHIRLVAKRIEPGVV